MQPTPTHYLNVSVQSLSFPPLFSPPPVSFLSNFPHAFLHLDLFTLFFLCHAVVEMTKTSATVDDKHSHSNTVCLENVFLQVKIENGFISEISDVRSDTPLFRTAEQMRFDFYFDGGDVYRCRSL